MVLNHVIGRCLVYDEKLTLSRTGLTRIAGPNMNCWSISHVSLSFVNLKKTNMKKLIPRPITTAKCYLQTCPDSLLGERGNTHSWRRGRTTVLPSV